MATTTRLKSRAFSRHSLFSSSASLSPLVFSSSRGCRSLPASAVFSRSPVASAIPSTSFSSACSGVSSLPQWSLSRSSSYFLSSSETSSSLSSPSSSLLSEKAPHGGGTVSLSLQNTSFRPLLTYSLPFGEESLSSSSLLPLRSKPRPSASSFPFLLASLSSPSALPSLSPLSPLSPLFLSLSPSALPLSPVSTPLSPVADPPCPVSASVSPFSLPPGVSASNAMACRRDRGGKTKTKLRREERRRRRAQTEQLRAGDRKLEKGSTSAVRPSVDVVLS